MQIATPELIRDVAARVVAFSDDGDQHDDRVVAMAGEALRFCLAAIAYGDGPGLLPVLEDLFAEAAWLVEDDPPEDLATEALKRVGHATEGIADLADCGAAWVRSAIAKGLPPHGPDEIDILFHLAADPDDSIRAAAREALGDRRDVPWWTGWFSHEPEAIAPELKALLDRLTRRFARQYRRDWRAMARIVRKLPDELAYDFVWTAVKARPSTILYPDSALLVAAMLERPGGAAELVQFLVRWDADDDCPSECDLQEYTDPVRGAAKARVCDALARFALDWCAGRIADASEYAASAAADAAAQGWSDVDPSWLLDEIAAIEPSERVSMVVYYLSHALTRARRVPSTVLDRVLVLRQQGYPRAFRHAVDSLNTVLARAPKELLRRAAAQAEALGDADTIRWSLEVQLGEAYDRRYDPPRRALLRRWLADPRLRPLVFESSTVLPEAIPLVRPAVARGELARAELLPVMRELAISNGPSAILDEVFSRRRMSRRGRPITNEEYAAWCKVRGDAPALASDEWVDALELIPPGPWTDDDREFARGAQLFAGTDGRLADCLADLLAAKADPLDRAWFDELLAIAPDDVIDDVRDARHKYDERVQAAEAARLARRAELRLLVN